MPYRAPLCYDAGMFEDVFVFANKKNKPQLIWSFVTGDRADGGLKDAYAEKGDLVVELYGKGPAIGKNPEDTEDVLDCCPDHYTISRYHYKAGRFRETGPEDVRPVPQQ